MVARWITDRVGRALAKARAFGAEEDGTVTASAIIWSVLFLVLGGLSVDMGNALRERARLQAAADSAALSGIIDIDTPATAESVALYYGNLNYDGTTKAGYVESGIWANGAFTATSTSPDAIRVATMRNEFNGNSVGTYLLRLIGIDEVGVSVDAVAHRRIGECFLSGMVARKDVKISSNNSFIDDYCIHGSEEVEISRNNRFEEGVKVTSSSRDNIRTNGSTLDTDLNPGLEQAVYPGVNTLMDRTMMIDEVASIVDAARAVADYTMNETDFEALIEQPEFLKGAHRGTYYQTTPTTYSVQCQGNGKRIRVPDDSEWHNVAVYTNCPIEVGRGSVLSGSEIATTNSGQNAVKIGQDVQVGDGDGCLPGGGSQILAEGDVHFASGTSFDGAQVIAGETIHIAAQSSGMRGATFQAESIQLTALGDDFAPNCTDNTDVKYFKWIYRLVE
ncbi:TadE/TadG family type IV pilus assembly protein [Oceanomicrobium pacificus]|uniref:Uncharacterized protein n=1 Tax=Oceanomicrobium pacificus TaxID=2692916 RepID=A0A6B0TQ57_9RHOB|nr:TadE/TadG family type IV pilus assembly protein [Oceanomicrobium pacificus]MXU63925.1 hypothetical protein [Oceanomicrobium pacificus]